MMRGVLAGICGWLTACAATPSVQAPTTTIIDQTTTSPCPLPGPYEFYPPSGFTPAHEQEIRAAAAKLNAITDEHHQITFSERGTNRILAFNPEPLPVGYLTGQWLSAYGVMLILPGTSPVYGVALHEFGHAVGMEHIASPGSVMCSQTKAPSEDVSSGWCGSASATELSGDDKIECVRVGACKPCILTGCP